MQQDASLKQLHFLQLCVLEAPAHQISGHYLSVKPVLMISEDGSTKSKRCCFPDLVLLASAKSEFSQVVQFSVLSQSTSSAPSASGGIIHDTIQQSVMSNAVKGITRLSRCPSFAARCLYHKLCGLL